MAFVASSDFTRAAFISAVLNDRIVAKVKT
jgi:hypothetical protein